MRKRMSVLLFFLFMFFSLSGVAPTAADYSVINQPNTFYFFHSSRCPHCKKALPFVKKLEREYPSIRFLYLELISSEKNRELFRKKIRELGIHGSGVPTFILGDRYIVGFKRGHHERMIRKMIDDYLARQHGKNGESAAASCIEIPLLGRVDPSLVSLPGFTLVIGLLDGVNPCAMWVLMFLLTLLVNAKSRKRLIMVGSVFVISSGVVYFLFMTAWLNIFLFMGVSSIITVGLGVIAIVMGLINLKEFFFFKKGVSLMIPESQKPKLYKKMRSVMHHNSWWLSLIGTITLAFFVNLIELGCTIGLPAIYTRVLSIQHIPVLTRYLYMALYNVYYIIPLAAIVLLFVVTLGKHRFEERHAKVLKVISGTLMLVLGLILVFRPELLQFS